MSNYPTLEQADNRAHTLFGEDSFCAIDYAGRCEVFYEPDGNIFDAVLIGRGGDFDEAFEMAIPHFERFYDKTNSTTQQ